MDYLGLALYAFDGTMDVPSEETNISITANTGYIGEATYSAGIGNAEEYRTLEGLVRAALGWGLEAKKSKMLTALARNIVLLGDKNVDVIGFSRGAITAVEFARALEKLKDEKVMPYCLVDKIRFMGLYDPVPGPTIFKPANIPYIVANTSIAYAMDEKRVEFSPTVYTGNAHAMLFRGGHSDVGGGYKERGLANITVEWMTKEGQAARAPFNNPTTSMLSSLEASGVTPTICK